MVLKGLHCSSTAASNSPVVHSHSSGSLYTEICLTGGCQVLSLSQPPKQKGGMGRTLTYISLPDVFHADDPHCQQMAWRWSLLLIKREVESPSRTTSKPVAAGEASTLVSLPTSQQPPHCSVMVCFGLFLPYMEVSRAETRCFFSFLLLSLYIYVYIVQ